MKKLIVLALALVVVVLISGCVQISPIITSIENINENPDSFFDKTVSVKGYLVEAYGAVPAPEIPRYYLISQTGVQNVSSVWETLHKYELQKKYLIRLAISDIVDIKEFLAYSCRQNCTEINLMIIEAEGVMKGHPPNVVVTDAPRYWLELKNIKFE